METLAGSHKAHEVRSGDNTPPQDNEDNVIGSSECLEPLLKNKHKNRVHADVFAKMKREDVVGADEIILGARAHDAKADQHDGPVVIINMPQGRL